ncbi:MAG: zf-HC2 domain-containing protein [Gemmatimonadota bacterium]|nr:zf-HC2 domain-containing protein [Gemmatimonadota bacterium]
MTRDIPCEEAARYVYRYLDGELEPRTRAEFLHHLETCRKCMGVVGFERRMLDFVRVRAASERPPTGLQDRVRRIFENEETA